MRTEASFSSTSASVLLDGLRGAAAVLVCLEHWRKLFFIDYQAINSHVPLMLFYLLAGAGHQAVVIFFVMSGYLISGSILRSVKSCNWTWRDYMTRRLTRLWLVLIPALVLGAFWDMLGLALRRSPQLYSGLIHNHMSSDVHQSLNLPAFLGNIFFLQTILVPNFGSNGALWSLANEFWYYSLFPLALFVFFKKYSHATRIIFALAFLAIAFFVGQKILLAFPIWLLGCLIHRLPILKIGSALRWCSCLVYTLLFFLLCAVDHSGGRIGVFRLPFLQGIAADYLLSILTFLLLWVLLSATRRSGTTPVVFFARASARFSYTLYLAHTPFLTFWVGFLIRDVRWFPSIANIALALIALAATLIYSWLLASVTEFKTNEAYDKFVKVVLNRLTRNQKQLAAA